MRQFRGLPHRLGQIVSLGLAVLASTEIAVLPPAAIAADLPAIAKRGRLIVAVKDNLPPLGFRDREGQLQGLEIDLARKLAEELLNRPNAVELKPVLSQNRFAAVLNGDVDIAIANVTLTPSRLRILRFSLPYYTDGTALITQTPSIQKLSDLAHQPIAVLNGSSTVEAIRRNLPGATLVGVDSYDAAQRLLENGSVVAFASDVTVLSGWTREFPQYRLLLPRLSSELLCVVLPKGHQYDELTQQIDLILSRLKNQGWLEQRAKYWGLPAASG